MIMMMPHTHSSQPDGKFACAKSGEKIALTLITCGFQDCSSKAALICAARDGGRRPELNRRHSRLFLPFVACSALAGEIAINDDLTFFEHNVQSEEGILEH